ncbi:MAG TPA: hypothetical protein PL048_17435, partial [Leptospiraceae bacterium]|nr:hypothetical protein [Leptospiraceae bacterium]
MILHPKNRELRDAFTWSVLFVLFGIIGYLGLQYKDGFILYLTQNSELQTPFFRFSTGMLLVSILFQFTACVGKKGGKDGTPP